MRRLLPVSGRARQSGDTSRLEFPRCVRQEWLLDQAADWPVDDPRFVVIADHLVAMIEDHEHAVALEPVGNDRGRRRPVDGRGEPRLHDEDDLAALLDEAFVNADPSAMRRHLAEPWRFSTSDYLESAPPRARGAG